MVAKRSGPLVTQEPPPLLFPERRGRRYYPYAPCALPQVGNKKPGWIRA
jgi:hypothetical protein